MKKSNKHNHAATHCLKIILFSIVMLMPLWVILIETLPYVFNDMATLPNGSLWEQAKTTLLASDLRSLTSNTLLYTGINAMNTQLNIVSPIITELLTYWLMLTSIYVIIDIVLEMFVFLTHWANDRI